MENNIDKPTEQPAPVAETTNQHPYADFLRALADGVPLDEFLSNGREHYFTERQLFEIMKGYLGYTITRKPPPQKTHVINGFEVPAPETEPLNSGQTYWTPHPLRVDWRDSYEWDGESVDQRALERGLIHLTREAAVANAKAMVGIDPATEGGAA